MNKIRLLITILFLLISAKALVFSQDDEKSTLIGNPLDDESAANIVADNAGNTYVGGMQNRKALIVKQNAIHATLWSKTLYFTTTPNQSVTLAFLDLVGDTVFGCGKIHQSSQTRGAFYFKMNAQTGALYWSKYDLTSQAYFSCMRYSNGKFFLIGGVQPTVPLGLSSSGKVMAVSSQTGNPIWETPLLQYNLPYTTPNIINATVFNDATEVVNGKLFITGSTSGHTGNNWIGMPVLVGITETGTIFMEKIINLPYQNTSASNDLISGKKIRLDMNQDLVIGAFHWLNTGVPTGGNLFLIKCDISGNLLYSKNYDIDNGSVAFIQSFNETAGSYVLFGANYGAYGGSHALKLAKNGNVQKSTSVSKPNVEHRDIGYSLGSLVGNSAFINGLHYFVVTEFPYSGLETDINQIILDEELSFVEDCSLVTEMPVIVTDVSTTVSQPIILHPVQSISFQNGGIPEDVTFGTYCDSISLDLGQNHYCNQAEITATISGFIDPTFYWSNGMGGDSIIVGTTDTVFLRVMDIHCCELIDTILPSIIPSSFTMSLPADTAVCLQSGSSFTITPTFSGANAPVQYLWSDNSTGASLAVTSSGTYWVAVSDSCLTRVDSIVVAVNSIPVIGNTANLSVCEDDFPVTLNPTVPAGTTVLWDNGTTSVVRSVNGPGTYTIVVTNGCGTTSSVIVVSQTNLPDVNLVSSIDTCIQSGGSIVLTPTLNDVNTLLWSDGSTGNQLAVSTSGSYTIYASNACGVDSATCAVTLNSLPVIGSTANVIVCEDDFPAALSPTVSAGATIVWDDGTTSTNRTVNGPGIYTISATNDCGTVSAAISVSQADLPDVQLISSVDSCLQTGGSIVLIPVLTDVSNVNWSNGNSGNQLTVSTSGNYTVYGSNGCGIDSATSSVTINYFPELDLPAVLDTCFDIGVGFSYTAQGSGGSYQWSSGSQSATEWISQEGIYSVTLTNQCGSITDSMQVRRLTAVDLYFPSDSIKECEKQLSVSQLQIETNYTLEIFAPGGDLVGTYLTESGWYQVHAFNPCGEVWDSIYVNLQNEQFFYLPNSFTPNADSNNERFEFKGENIVVREVRIFNRWGEEIFTENGTFSGWDGTYRGENCPVGIYAVHLIYEDCFGIPAEFNGHVNLIK